MSCVAADEPVLSYEPVMQQECEFVLLHESITDDVSSLQHYLLQIMYIVYLMIKSELHVHHVQIRDHLAYTQ